MSFFRRYVLVYLVMAALLLAVAAFAGYATGAGTGTWLATVALLAWLLAYPPYMLWRDYRRLMQLTADLRDGKLDERIRTDRVRDQVLYLAVEYAGVPRFVATLLVPRILTDDVIGLMTARLDRSLHSLDIARPHSPSDRQRAA